MELEPPKSSSAAVQSATRAAGSPAGEIPAAPPPQPPHAAAGELPLSSPIETMGQAMARAGIPASTGVETQNYSVPTPVPPVLRPEPHLAPAGIQANPAAVPPSPQPAAEPRAASAASPAHIAPVPRPDAEHPIDAQSFVLPQKKADPSLLSAQRADAGAVLRAANAALPRTAAPAPNATFGANTEYARGEIPTVHTFRSDVEETVQKKNLTLARIAAAEGGRAAAPLEEESRERGSRVARALEIGGGIALALAALSLIAFAVLRSAPAPQTPAPSASFVYVDDTQNVSVPPSATGPELLQELAARMSRLALSLGLMERFNLYTPAAAASNAAQELSAQQFLALIAPDAPGTLARSLLPQFLIGAHSFDGNQPFIVFRTDPSSYDEAFASMLGWEPYMASDLAPLLEHAASSTASAAGTAQVLATPFVDATIDNHDARVLKNPDGTIVLMWSFLDRSTLAITTNEHTLAEIISRLTQAPTVPSSGA